MVEPAPCRTARSSREDHAAAQARGREVERRLAEAALGRGPRGLAGEAPHFDGGFGRRLRLALETLGPVFSAFGRYLGSRPDLLPLTDCFELRQTVEAAEPMSPAAVHALVESETGVPLGEAFGEIEAAPLRWDLLLQTHRARLPDGRETLIQLLRPDCGASLESDLPHLRLLAVAFGREGRPFPIEQAITDFQRALAARADLPAAAGTLRALRIEVARLGTLRLPRIVLATPRLLCLELLEGASLGSLRPSLAAPASGTELADLARRLCLAWLYHALRGKAFPVEIVPGLVLLADGGIGLQGGTFASLSVESQSSLQAYIEAAAAEDPDEACRRLLHEMQPAPAEAELELRQRLRQSVAFRDGGWGSALDGQSLSEQLFVQWRLAAELGFVPLPHLEAFYRGLFELAMTVRPLAPPESDPLREALESLRLLGVADQLGEMADFGRLRRCFEGYAAILADLPMMMDGALGPLGEGRPRLRIEVDEAGTGGRGNGKALPLALALALGAVALVTVRLGAAPAAGPWFQAVGATLFTLLGGLLLRALGRRS